ncbi:hypothetical protein T492DRAFT_876299, partial [Pavlovales sp. CCMP2436]
PATVAAAFASSEPATKPTAIAAAVATSEHAAQAAAIAAAVASSEPTTEPPTPPTAESATISSTEPAAEPAAEPASIVSAEPAAQPASQPPSVASAHAFFCVGGGSGTLGAGVQGVVLSVAGKTEYGWPRPSTLSAVLITSAVYFDRSDVHLAYRLHDETGEWFSESADITCRVVVNGESESMVLPSLSFDLTLAQQPPPYYLDTVGVLLQMPAYPIFAGSNFSAVVTANTAFPLFAFDLSLAFNASLLAIESITPSSLFNEPRVSSLLEGSAGQLRAVAGGLDPAHIPAQAQGTAVELMRITLRLSPDAPPDTQLDGIISLAVGEFVNAFNIAYLRDAPGLVADGDAEPALTGSLQTASQTTAVGHLYYADESELLNTELLNGQEATTNLHVWAVTNDPTEPPAELTSGLSCESANVASAGGEGKISVRNQATGALIATVPLRVWFPLSAELALDETLVTRAPA